MLLHLAKVLQISGFLLAAIFGGILLNHTNFVMLVLRKSLNALDQM